MKNVYLVVSVILALYLTSCSKSPSEKAQSNIKTYLKETLKNSTYYEPISFSEIDTLEKIDTTSDNRISLYIVNHVYNITNSKNIKVKMQVSFYLDQNLLVNRTGHKSINGEFGAVTGNAYWKYNNYIGNKPDAGSTVTLFTLDSVRGDLKFEATADVQGNYRIENVPPGKYFLIVRSNNSTDCPDAHLQNFMIHSTYIKQVLGFDIKKYSDEIAKIDKIDSLGGVALNTNFEGPNGASKSLEIYYKYKQQSREMAERLFELFPKEFTNKINFFSGYSKAYEMKVIYIEDGENENIVTDFDITCI